MFPAAESDGTPTETARVTRSPVWIPVEGPSDRVDGPRSTAPRPTPTPTVLHEALRVRRGPGPTAPSTDPSDAPRPRTDVAPLVPSQPPPVPRWVAEHLHRFGPIPPPPMRSTTTPSAPPRCPGPPTPPRPTPVLTRVRSPPSLRSVDNLHLPPTSATQVDPARRPPAPPRVASSLVPDVGKVHGTADGPWLQRVGSRTPSRLLPSSVRSHHPLPIPVSSPPSPSDVTTDLVAPGLLPAPPTPPSPSSDLRHARHPVEGQYDVLDDLLE